jgi:hypothetical protein
VDLVDEQDDFACADGVEGWGLAGCCLATLGMLLHKDTVSWRKHWKKHAGVCQYPLLLPDLYGTTPCLITYHFGLMVGL